MTNIEYVRVFLVDLPHAVKAYTKKNSDGGYTILINARLNAEEQFKAYKHEIAHIDNGDYDKEIVNVNKLEHERHAG